MHALNYGTESEKKQNVSLSYHHSQLQPQHRLHVTSKLDLQHACTYNAVLVMQSYEGHMTDDVDTIVTPIKEHSKVITAT